MIGQWTVRDACESPIEEMLCRVLFEHFGCRPVVGRCDPDNLARFAGTQPAAFLFAQHDIGRYRADFLLVLMNPRENLCRQYVLECDGAQFHTSPEQIAHDAGRDAFMEKLGYRVLRFTGSEIHTRMDNIVQRLAELFKAFGVAASTARFDISGPEGLRPLSDALERVLERAERAWQAYPLPDMPR